MSDLGANDFPELPRPFSSTVHVDVFGMSDQGHVRKNNEDHYLVIRSGRVLETVASNLASRPGDRFEETGYGFVVADGVGGEAAGEVASHEAILRLLNLALQTPDWQFNWGPKEMNTVKFRMQDRLRRVNSALLQQASTHEGLKGMCTTMTAALSHGDDLVIGHVGDSRAYLVHEEKLRRLTRDHTVAERLMNKPHNPIDDRLLKELKNVLMQALGGNERECAPDVEDYILEDGDQLLLCTDGLTDMVDDREIESILLKGNSAQSACRTLVDTALNNGGRDNVTVIVARYSMPPG